MNHLTRALKIHRGEERTAILIIGIMLITSAGFTLGSTGVEALFFARFGVQFLPYMYMALGIVSFFITLGITAMLGRVRHETFYLVLPLAIAATLIGGWALLFTNLNALYPVLWLVLAVVDSLLNLVVWGFASMMYNTRQSKRLFPLFNTGRILGSVIGGFSTSFLVNQVGTENLLLVMSGTMLAAFILGKILLDQDNIQGVQPGRTQRQRSNPGIIAEMQKGYQYVRRSELMRLVSVSAILFSVLFFSIALPFSKAATAQIMDEDALASFLGLFNALSTGGAFLTSLFFANRLFGRFGIMPMLMLLPIIYLIGFGTLAVYEIFAVLVVFRFFKLLWMNGVAVSAWQALFNTVSNERRDQVRAFINGVPSQAGTFIAGAILLIGEQAFSPQQLYLIGLGAAITTCLVIWRASFAYKHALVDALRFGRPILFINDDEPFGGFQQDSTTVDVALEGINHNEPQVRRTAAEILGSMEGPRALDALVGALNDSNNEVRAVSLQALARAGKSATILEVAAQLNDQDIEVRTQAIETLCSLTKYPQGLKTHLEPLLNDSAGIVRCRAAMGLLRLGKHPKARDLLRSMAVFGEQEDRIHAIQAMAEWGDQEAISLIETELNDKHAPSSVRRAAAVALGSFGSKTSTVLLKTLSDDDLGVRNGAISGLAQIGPQITDSVLNKLSDPDSEEGALKVLENLPCNGFENQLRDYAQLRITSAIHYKNLWNSIASRAEDSATQILSDSLQNHAQQNGIKALTALSLISDRDTISVAIDNIQGKDLNQHANALETLETVRDASVIRPLMNIWEQHEPLPTNGNFNETLVQILEGEQNGWLRACAAFALPSDLIPGINNSLSHLAQTDPDPLVREIAAFKIQNGKPMDTIAKLSIMERILILRSVPLLADLSPADLKRVAAIATEHQFFDGEIIFEQNDPGNEMYVVVSGEVQVLVNDENNNKKEVARRKSGDSVGEMSVISGSLRSASLSAVGEVHLLCLDQKSFEGLLRERPEVSLAVMRMLCDRLEQVTQRENATYD